MQEILAETVQNSFSIVVAIYLLVRMEKRLEQLTKAIHLLHHAIATRRDGG